MELTDQVLPNRVYNELYALILEQSLGPGARLNIDGLARQLKVSQTPIRQALARLSAEGMVVNKPNAGFRVSDLPSKEHLVETLVFRKMFEPRITALAATRITPDGRDRLKKNMADMRDAVNDQDFSQFRIFLVDREFHELLAEHGGNAVVHSTLSRLILTSSLFRLKDAPRTPDEILSEHDRIATAVLDGDAASAEAMMAEHLQISIDRASTL